MSTTRRTILAGLATAPLAPVTVTAPASLDTALLALVPAIKAAYAALDVAIDRVAAADVLEYARLPSPDREAADAAEKTVCDALGALRDRIAAMPARTVAGLRVKLLAAGSTPEDDPDMMASIVADILAMDGGAV